MRSKFAQHLPEGILLQRHSAGHNLTLGMHRVQSQPPFWPESNTNQGPYTLTVILAEAWDLCDTDDGSMQRWLPFNMYTTFKSIKLTLVHGNTRNGE